MGLGPGYILVCYRVAVMLPGSFSHKFMLLVSSNVTRGMPSLSQSSPNPKSSPRGSLELSQTSAPRGPLELSQSSPSMKSSRSGKSSPRAFPPCVHCRFRVCPLSFRFFVKKWAQHSIGRGENSFLRVHHTSGVPFAKAVYSS